MRKNPLILFEGGAGQARMDADALRRLRWIIRLAVAWAVLILLRLVQLQVVEHAEYTRIAESQHERVVAVKAPRGAIFDREGRPLAVSLRTYDICVNPRFVRDPATTAKLLAGILNLEADVLQQKIQAASAAGRGFLWVKRRASAEECKRIERLKLSGVEFREEMTRHYPKGELGAHLIGSVDHEQNGNAGIELGLQNELAGIAGTERLLRDVANRGLERFIESEAVPGKNVTLTIDERIQYAAEHHLKAAVKEHRCKSGVVVVLDPRQGDILAMANYPTFDPNEPVKDHSDLQARLNLAVSAPFEPGSVFKVVTVAAALETTNLSPDTPINCLGGVINLYGRTIHEAKHGFSIIPVRTVLAKSSNVGAIQIALRMGVQNFYDYILKFGLGRKTGIPLPAESPGQVYPPQKWGKTSIGSVAMGHEVMVTALQLAQVGAVIANDGVLVRPRLVLRKQRPGGPLEKEPPAERIRVLSPRSARLMREMLEGAVMEGGTGTRARLAGYRVGGKTGSAQIYDHATRQYTHKYNASFLGIVPLSNPAIVVVVSLHGASEFGGVVAAPVFREVAQEALRILDVPQDRIELPPSRLARSQEQAPGSENDLAEPPPVELAPHASAGPAAETAAFEPPSLLNEGPKTSSGGGRKQTPRVQMRAAAPAMAAPQLVLPPPILTPAAGPEPALPEERMLPSIRP